MSETPAEATVAQEPVSSTEQFLEKNFTKLLIVAAVIVVAMLGYGWVSYQAKMADNSAAEAFTAAKTVEDCDLVIAEHAGSAAAGNARLFKADLLWEQNKKDSSTSVLREFLKEDEGHPLYPEALLGLASKLESMGEADEAQPLFEQVVNDFSDASVAPLAGIRLGDLLWSQGKEDEAKQVYEDLAIEFPNTNEPFFEQSQSRLTWMTAQLPTKEVEPPESAKKAEEKKDELPIGLKKPQIQVPGLGATISPDGGAMTSPISPAGQLPTPPTAPMTPPTLQTDSPLTDAAAKATEKKADPKTSKAPAPKAKESKAKAKTGTPAPAKTDKPANQPETKAAPPKAKAKAAPKKTDPDASQAAPGEAK